MTAPADGRPPIRLVPADRLATLGDEELVAALRPLWEDAVPLARAVRGVAVASWSEHLVQAEAAIAAMDDATKVELLRSHPPIGAPAAALDLRSPTSLAEQGGSDADRATLSRLRRANDAYEHRHGFPFVEWVAGRSRAEMCDVLESRTGRDRETELAAGCAALVAIARDRLGRSSVTSS